MIDVPYNPLDRKNLGASVAEALLERLVRPLAEVVANKFQGAGIYVIYYTGPFPAYAQIAEMNRNGQFKAPIYIGKAVPEGARKGGRKAAAKDGQSAKPKNPNLAPLHKRLSEHFNSIKAATSLDVSHFYCRYLLVEDIWIPLGETLLITKYQPIWNLIAEGFGNHTPGKGRFEGAIPKWDVLHPGRNWGSKCKPRTETPDDIVAEIHGHFRDNLSTILEVKGAADFARMAETAPTPQLDGEADDPEEKEEADEE